MLRTSASVVAAAFLAAGSQPLAAGPQTTPPAPAKVFVFATTSKAPQDPGLLESVADFRRLIGEKFATSMRDVDRREDADVSVEVLDRTTRATYRQLSATVHARGGSTNPLYRTMGTYMGCADAFLDAIDAWLKEHHGAAVGVVPVDDERAISLPVYLYLKELTHREADNRANAASSLARRKARAALVPLVDLLDDEAVVVPFMGNKRDTTTVSRIAARAMMIIGGVQPLADVLATAPKEKVRVNAASAFGDARGPAVEKVLATALRDDQAPRVRKAAAASLRKLRARGAADALIAALRDADGGVREEAARALKDISGLNYGLDAARWSAWAASGK